MSLNVLTSRLMLGLSDFAEVVTPKAYQEEVQGFVNDRKLRKESNRKKGEGEISTETRIQFMSDLHLERVKYGFDTDPVAPILLLAGDIGRFRDGDDYKSFLAKQCDKYDSVLWVAGNHEFYGTSREEGLKVAQAFANDACMNGKLHFLDRARIDLPGTDATILGCTLHSHIGPDYTALTNDFAQIKGWKVHHHNEEHERDAAWLKASLQTLAAENHPRRVIIVTHYAPSFEQTTHPLNENSAVSQCFSSRVLYSLSQCSGFELVSDWIYGHTHWNARFRVGKVVVQSNHFCNDSSRLSWLQKKMKYRPFNPTAVLKV